MYPKCGFGQGTLCRKKRISRKKLELPNGFISLRNEIIPIKHLNQNRSHPHPIVSWLIYFIVLVHKQKILSHQCAHRVRTILNSEFI